MPIGWWNMLLIPPKKREPFGNSIDNTFPPIALWFHLRLKHWFICCHFGGWNFLPNLMIGNLISHYKDSYEPTRIQWNVNVFWSLPSSRPKISTKRWLQWWISGFFHKPIFFGSGNLHHLFWISWNIWRGVIDQKVCYALGFFKTKKATFLEPSIDQQIKHGFLGVTIEVSDVIRRWWFRNPKPPPGMYGNGCVQKPVLKTWGDLLIYHINWFFSPDFWGCHQQ